MSNEDTQEEAKTLGAILRNHREQQGASLVDVRENTRISLPVLTAIENDDHVNMPAEAFCRGFYTLYADFLGLDKNEILELFTESRKLLKTTKKSQATPPINNSLNFSSYAEPSSMSPGIIITIFIIICLVLVAGVCLCFQWNPIEYLTTKLTPPQTCVVQEQAQPFPDSPDTTEKNISITESETNTVSSEVLPLTILTVPHDDTKEQVSEIPPPPETTGGPYSLEMNLQTNGTLKVTLDDGFILDKHFTSGDTLHWDVKKKIILDMPAKISGNLRLNGIDIPFPNEKNGRRILSLPEDLLD